MRRDVDPSWNFQKEATKRPDESFQLHEEFAIAASQETTHLLTQTMELYYP